MGDTDNEFGGGAPVKKKRRKFRIFRSKKKQSDVDLFADSDSDEGQGGESGRGRTQTETTAESNATYGSSSSSRRRRGFSFFKRGNSKSSLAASDTDEAKSEGYTTEEDKRSQGSRRKGRSFLPKLFRSRSRKKRDLSFDSSDDEDDADAARKGSTAGGEAQRGTSRTETSAAESIPVPVKGREKYTDEEMKQVEKDLDLTEPESEEDVEEKKKREEMQRREEELKRQEEEMKEKEEAKRLEAERRREEMKKQEEELKRQEEELKKRLDEEAERRKKREEELEKKKKEAEERRKQLEQKADGKKKGQKKKSKLAQFLEGGKDEDEEPEEEPGEGGRKRGRRGRKYVQDLPEFEEEDVRLAEDSIFSASDDEYDVKNDLSHSNYGNYLERNNKDPSKRTLVKKRRRSKKRRSRHRDKPKVEKEARYSLLNRESDAEDSPRSTGDDDRDEDGKSRRRRGRGRAASEDDEDGYSSSEEIKNADKGGSFGHREMRQARAELERKRDKLLQDKLRQEDNLEDEGRVDDEERLAEAEIEQLRAEVRKLEEEEDARDKLKKSMRGLPSKRDKRRSKRRSKRHKYKEEINVAPLLNYNRTRWNQGVVMGLVEDFLNFYAKPYFLLEWVSLAAMSAAIGFAPVLDKVTPPTQYFMRAGYFLAEGALHLLSDEEPITLFGVVLLGGAAGAALKHQLPKDSFSRLPKSEAAGMVEGATCGLFGYLLIRGAYDVRPLNRLVAFLVSCLCIATAMMDTSLVEPNPISVVGIACGSLIALMTSKDNYNTAVRYYSSLALIE